MEHKRLGITGVMVPEIGLGVWRYSGGPAPLRHGIDLGASLLDTAEVFSPSREELLEWKSVVEAMEEAWAKGLGAVALNGALIDEAHWHTGRQALEHARKLGIEV